MCRLDSKFMITEWIFVRIDYQLNSLLISNETCGFIKLNCHPSLQRNVEKNTY